MARLPYRNRSEVPAEHQSLMKRDIALNRQLIHSPGALRAFQGLGGYIRFDSKIDPRLRELAILQVGYLARSAYEWSHHIKIGYDFGVTENDIRGLIAETEGRTSDVDAPTRLVLRAAREITADGKLGAESFAALHASWSAEAMVDFVLSVAFYNAVVRVLASLEIDVEPEYQTYLDQFPLPGA